MLCYYKQVFDKKGVAAMKKKWPILLGASLVTGFIGSLALRKKEESPANDISSYYVGSWWFIDKAKKSQHKLTIKQDLLALIDDNPIKGTLIELTAARMVLRDQYGYHLIVTLEEMQPVSLYDEADDCHYPLERVKDLTEFINEE